LQVIPEIVPHIVQRGGNNGRVLMVERILHSRVFLSITTIYTYSASTTVYRSRFSVRLTVVNKLPICAWPRPCSPSPLGSAMVRPIRIALKVRGVAEMKNAWYVEAGAVVKGPQGLLRALCCLSKSQHSTDRFPSQSRLLGDSKSITVRTVESELLHVSRP
jgi:hypothetical protein